MLDCIQSANRQILPYVVTVPLLLDQVIVTLLNPATDSRCVLFPPSDSRRIKVITVVPRGSGVAETTLRELLAPSRGGVGNFAVGDFRFKDTPIAFGFYLDPPNEDYRNQNPTRQHSVSAKEWPSQASPISMEIRTQSILKTLNLCSKCLLSTQSLVMTKLALTSQGNITMLT